MFARFKGDSESCTAGVVTVRRAHLERGLESIAFDNDMRDHMARSIASIFCVMTTKAMKSRSCLKCILSASKLISCRCRSFQVIR